MLKTNKDGRTVYLSDVAKINAAVGSTVTFKVTATDAVTFTIYGLQSNGKLKSLKTLKLKTDTETGSEVAYTFKEKDGSEFYIGVASANAKKGCEAYYNVQVLPGDALTGESLPEAAVGLASSELDGLIGGLNLDLAQATVDVLATGSASGLADAALLDEYSAWRNIAGLA